MTSRERLIKALNHVETDRPPVDLGATNTTGISALSLHHLREKLGLKGKVRIAEPFQILGEVDDEVRKALEVDVVGIFDRNTFFGYQNGTGWKDWNFKGVDMLIGEGFITTTDEKGDTFVYPQGDLTAQPSGRLPADGYYFDGILREEEVDEDALDPVGDFKEQFRIMSEEDLLYLQKQAEHVFNDTEYGSILMWGGGALGDVALLPGTGLKYTPGVRNIEEWYMYHLLHPEYITELFAFQTEIAIENLKLLKEALGNKIQALYVSGTDFGTQLDTLIRKDLFVEMYKPFYRKINDWIHKHTCWKTFYHSCGAIKSFIPEFIDMGVDILNPVQCSAVGMEPKELKDTFGDDIVFWGGAVDTQKTLPFGTPKEVYTEAKERCDIFKKGGGFVFNSVHNIQAGTSPENILAFFEAAK